MFNPVIFATEYFSQRYTYNPINQTLDVFTQANPSQITSETKMPLVLSSTGSNHAIAIFSPDNAFQKSTTYLTTYGIDPSRGPYPFNDVRRENFMAISPLIRMGPRPAGRYPIRSFVVVGSLAEVQNSLQTLYNKFETNFIDPIPGRMLSASCENITGRLGTANGYDTVNSVKLYTQNSDGYRVFLSEATVEADRTFSIATPDSIKNGTDMFVSAFVELSQNDYLKEAMIGLNPVAVNCPDTGIPLSEPVLQANEFSKI